MNIFDTLKAEFVREKFPDTIQKSDGTPWVVDAIHQTEIGETRSGAFFYQNADMPADRFYFDTFEAAAVDLFDEIADRSERLDIVRIAARQLADYGENIACPQKVIDALDEAADLLNTGQQEAS